MDDIASDTVGGFNRFLADQKVLPGECSLSLFQFNTQFDTQFIFLAANQDAIQVGASYGFPAINSMSYGHDSAGTASSYGTMSSTASAFRSSGLVPEFTKEQRVAASGTTGPAWGGYDTAKEK